MGLGVIRLAVVVDGSRGGGNIPWRTDREPQVVRLAEFPVDLGGVDRLYAVFSYGKPHTRLCLGAAGRKFGLRS
jgi:hypothetical protein